MPEMPGVYLFKDDKGEIIYIGKAKKIRTRVRSYFQKSNGELKSKRIREYIADIEIITTNSEVEALVLENNLIKLHKPRLNLRLKDDKTYPYIRITLTEEIPRVEIVRKRTKPKDYYFGPFSDVKSLRLTLKEALVIFPVARCKKKIVYGKEQKGCLYSQLGRCLAPCRGEIPLSDYQKTVQQFITFFEGKHKTLLEELKKEMAKASQQLEFEKAALLRDRIFAIERTIQKQTIVAKEPTAEYDIIGVMKEEELAIVQLLVLRQGAIIGEKHFYFDLPYELTEEELIETFIKQYYPKADFIPRTILIEKKIKDEKVVNEWLNSLKQRKREQEQERKSIRLPENEEEKAFLKLAKQNARSNLQIKSQTIKLKHKKSRKALTELKERLELKKIPRRIEGYDVSTLSGTETVGSCVVFEDGLPNKRKYRKFIVKTIEIQNDYDALREIIRRRFTGTLAKREEEPEMILIDGGSGQVNCIEKELKQLKKEIPVFGLAKRFETIHFPGTKKTLALDEHSEALKLLQRIRNEAHRFAIGFHRQKRRKKMTRSALEEINGLGKKIIALLREHFKDSEEIKTATKEELIRIKGIGPKLAEKILAFYRQREEI